MSYTVHCAVTTQYTKRGLTPLITLVQPARPVVRPSSPLTPGPMTSIHPPPLPDDQQCWMPATRVGRASCWLSIHFAGRRDPAAGKCNFWCRNYCVQHIHVFQSEKGTHVLNTIVCALQCTVSRLLLTTSADCWSLLLSCMLCWCIPSIISNPPTHMHAAENTPGGGKNNVNPVSCDPNHPIRKSAVGVWGRLGHQGKTSSTLILLLFDSLKQQPSCRLI